MRDDIVSLADFKCADLTLKPLTLPQFSPAARAHLLQVVMFRPERSRLATTTTSTAGARTAKRGAYLLLS